MWSMIEYETEQYRGYKFEQKLNFHLVPSELLAKKQSQYYHLPAWLALLLVTLKGLGGKLFLLHILNLYAIQIHILSCSLWLQFARLLIRLWALVSRFQNKEVKFWQLLKIVKIETPWLQILDCPQQPASKVTFFWCCIGIESLAFGSRQMKIQLVFLLISRSENSNGNIKNVDSGVRSFFSEKQFF